MAKYYVNSNAQTTGEHEVHKEGCTYMPAVVNQVYLGEFYGCQAAVQKAKEHYTNVDGCAYCCPDCHTK